MKKQGLIKKTSLRRGNIKVQKMPKKVSVMPKESGEKRSIPKVDNPGFESYNLDSMRLG